MSTPRPQHVIQRAPGTTPISWLAHAELEPGRLVSCVTNRSLWVYMYIRMAGRAPSSMKDRTPQSHDLHARIVCIDPISPKIPASPPFPRGRHASQTGIIFGVARPSEPEPRTRRPRFNEPTRPGLFSWTGSTASRCGEDAPTLAALGYIERDWPPWNAMLFSALRRPGALSGDGITGILVVLGSHKRGRLSRSLFTGRVCVFTGIPDPFPLWMLCLLVHGVSLPGHPGLAPRVCGLRFCVRRNPRVTASKRSCCDAPLLIPLMMIATLLKWSKWVQPASSGVCRVYRVSLPRAASDS